MSETKKADSGKADTFIRLFWAVVLLALIGFLGHGVYKNAVGLSTDQPFKLGLDLAGGSHLVYEADISKVDSAEVPELMNVLRDVIERRINVFGVSEPNVYVESSSFVSEVQRQRLVIELPGVTDVAAAVKEIGETPLLEFKLIDDAAATEAESLRARLTQATSTSEKEELEVILASLDSPYKDTGLTGRYLETARLEFTSSQSGQLANEPIVSIRFNAEGSKLFADLTRDNTGERLAIFLDGEVLSAPVINEAITGGQATISGGFTAEEARDLAQNLSFGALPLPIKLESTQTVGSTLGHEVLEKGIMAGTYGIGLVILFMIVWYRVPGLIASLGLGSYLILMLYCFQSIPVTLTAAGLAGFILSLGMAVDANVLVYERMKEEIKAGKSSREAAREGFRRAWGAIRDGNVTSILSAIILFWFGTSIVKGFALVFGLGVVMSMVSALVIGRIFLLALPDLPADRPLVGKLFGSGFSK